MESNDPGRDARKRWLIAAAAPKEVRAILDGLLPGHAPPIPVPEVWSPIEIAYRDPQGRDEMWVDVLRTGVGKAASAGAIGRWFDPDRHAGVLSLGIAGCLPGAWLEIGSVVLADPSVMTDEGSVTPREFVGLDAMGFGEDAPAIRADDPSRFALTPLVDVVGPVATVSVCSGTDDWAGQTARRCGSGSGGGGGGGLAEAMEGAAIGLAARRIDPGARFAEVRVISNSTGDRGRQRWDLALALGRLSELAGPIVSALGDSEVR